LKHEAVVVHVVDLPTGQVEREVEDPAVRSAKHNGTVELCVGGEDPHRGTIERINDQANDEVAVFALEIGAEEELVIASGAMGGTEDLATYDLGRHGERPECRRFGGCGLEIAKWSAGQAASEKCDSAERKDRGE